MYTKRTGYFSGKEVARIGTFLWTDTKEGLEYWANLDNICWDECTPTQPNEYFLDHHQILKEPPKCVKIF